MGSDNIAIQQREKEARSLRTLLACSLVGSVALHVGLLYAGIDKFWQRNFTQPKPIEVVIVDPPKKPEVKKPEPTPEPPKPQPQPRRVQQPRVRQPQRVVRQSPPPRVVRATPKPVPRAVTPPPKAATPKPAPAPKVENVKPAPTPVATPDPQLRSKLSDLRNARAEREKVLTGTGNPQAPAVAPSPSTGTGRTPIAAGPRTVRQPQSGTGDSEGSNTLTCRRCPEPRYPASARRRGVEGVPKVAFYVDRDGNVSNVQLVQSSGDEDLDAAALKQVSRWKYNDLKRERRVVLRVRFVLN